VYQKEVKCKQPISYWCSNKNVLLSSPAKNQIGNYDNKKG